MTAELTTHRRAGADRAGAPEVMRPSLTTPLVGREQELRALLRTARRAPAVAVLEGGEGMGKTRLIAELLASPEVRGRRQLFARFGLDGQGDGNEPLLGLLAQLEMGESRTPGSPPRWASPAPLDRGIAQRTFLWRLLELLRRAGPVVCVLEDVHMCSEQAAELLRPLVGGLPAGVVLIVSVRGEAVPPWSPLRGMTSGAPATMALEHLRLGPLDPAGVREQVASVAGGEASTALCSALWERTAGVPGAVVATLSLLGAPLERETHTQPLGATLEMAPVPPTIHAQTVAALGGVSPASRHLVQASAILGTPATEAMLATLSARRPGELAPALISAMEAGLLVEEGRGAYRLPSPLIADAVRETLAADELRRLHARAARLLEAHGPRLPLLLARHHGEAGDLAQWARWAEVAVTEAGATGDAAALLPVLADLRRRFGVPAAAMERLAAALAIEVQRHWLEQPEVAGRLREVIEAAPLPAPARGECRLVLARMLIHAGDVPGWREQLNAAVADLGSRPARRAAVRCELAVPWIDQGTVAAKRRGLGRAAGIAARSRDGRLSRVARLTEALVSAAIGDPGARQSLERGRRAASTGAAPQLALWAAWNAGLALLWSGHLGAARAALDDAAALAAELGYGGAPAACEPARLELDWYSGTWTGLEERVRHQLTEGESSNRWSAWLRLVLGRWLTSQNRLEEAERQLRLATEGAGRAGIVPTAVVATGWWARVWLVRGQPAKAAELALGAIRLASRQGAWVWAAEAAVPAVQAQIACGRLAAATETARRFSQAIEGRDAPRAAAVERQCAGLVQEASGEHRRAYEAFRSAHDRFAAIANPHDVAEAAAAGGVNAVLCGLEQGPALLLEALALFEGLGAMHGADLVRDQLGSCAVPVPRRPGRGRPGYGSALSPREEEVAVLAAEGRTNGEIGRKLFVSARTVEHQLSAAMRKLSVASRRDLPDALRIRSAAGSTPA